MSADDIKLPPLPVDSETPASSQWQWSDRDMHAFARAAIDADRASHAAAANALAPGYLSDDLPTLRKRVSALIALVSAKEAQCSHLAKELADLRASTNPDLLASERQANAILTDELERLRAAPSPQGDAEEGQPPPWMMCESRGPWAANSLRVNASGMRDGEKRCRSAFRKDYMGEPARFVADAYGEAAAVFEARLAVIDAARSTPAKGGEHG